MNVYARHRDGQSHFLGTTHDRIPRPKPGDWFSVEAPMTTDDQAALERYYSPKSCCLPHEPIAFMRHIYRCGVVSHSGRPDEVAVIISPDSPPPKHLPGWSPAHDHYSLQQAG